MRESVVNKIKQNKIFAILRGIHGKTVLQLAEALLRGGINLMEITFDQKDSSLHKLTCDDISALNKELGDHVTVGAGTVTSTSLAQMAFDSGSQFIVSPNVDQQVIAHTVQCGMVSIPGGLTPTEILNAYNAGADFVKLFPAGVFGEAYLKAIIAPINHIGLIAVGGVNEENANSFINAGCVGVGIGGNLVNKEWISNGEFDRITNLSRKIIESIHSNK